MLTGGKVEGESFKSKVKVCSSLPPDRTAVAGLSACTRFRKLMADAGDNGGLEAASLLRASPSHQMSSVPRVCPGCWDVPVPGTGSPVVPWLWEAGPIVP